MDESGESAIQKVADILTTEAMDRIGNIHEKLQTVFK
jgi:putative SOS response-associated peptidase YedK